MNENKTNINWEKRTYEKLPKSVENADFLTLNILHVLIKIGREYNLSDNELKDLFVLGFNHDIGYEFIDNLKHAQMGGEILNKADMQIDKYGNDIGYAKRLEDIKNRYGEESKTYCDAKILIENLKGD